VEKEQADALKAAKASKKTSDDENDEDRWVSPKYCITTHHNGFLTVFMTQ
jgi:hypothetical protein